jgi:hypothetical protein
MRCHGLGVFERRPGPGWAVMPVVGNVRQPILTRGPSLAARRWIICRPRALLLADSMR